MVEKGTLYMCDRCGKHIFFKEDPANTPNNTYLASDWDYRAGKLLCPDCKGIFDVFMKGFIKNN